MSHFYKDLKTNLLKALGIQEKIPANADAVTLYFLIGLKPALLAGFSVEYLTRPNEYVLNCNSKLSNSTIGVEFCIGHSCCRNECPETYFYEFLPYVVGNLIGSYTATRFAAVAWLAWFDNTRGSELQDDAVSRRSTDSTRSSIFSLLSY